MKRTILALVAASAMQLPATTLYDAIAYVESRGIDCSVGDNGKAVGRYQLHKVYVDDVNRIADAQYTYADRTNPIKSLEMVKIYIGHYSDVYTMETGLPATDEIKARIHNGGPYGYRKDSTLNYWKEVKEAMKHGQ